VENHWETCAKEMKKQTPPRSEKPVVAAQADARELGLTSFSTITLNSAVTPWTSFTGTMDSPMILMGSSSAIRPLVNLKALRLKRIGEIARSYRAEKLVGFAGLAGEFDDHLI